MAASGTWSFAQQAMQPPPAAPVTKAPQLDPVIAGRSARNLLRNGVDYLDTYRDPRRALIYLQAAASRGTELSASETKMLADAMARAQAMIQAGSPTQPFRSTQIAGTAPRPATPQPRTVPAADAIRLTGAEAMAPSPAAPSQPAPAAITAAPAAQPARTASVPSTAAPRRADQPLAPTYEEALSAQPSVAEKPAAAKPDAVLDLPVLQAAAAPVVPPPAAATVVAPRPNPGSTARQESPGNTPSSQPARVEEPAESTLDLIPAPTAEDLETLPSAPRNAAREEVLQPQLPGRSDQDRSDLPMPEPAPAAPTTERTIPSESSDPVAMPPLPPPRAARGSTKPEAPAAPVLEPSLPDLPPAQPRSEEAAAEDVLPPLPGDPQNQSATAPPAPPQPLTPPARLPETPAVQTPVMPADGTGGSKLPAIASPLTTAARELDGPVSSVGGGAAGVNSLPPLPPPAEELPPLPQPTIPGGESGNRSPEVLDEELPPLPPDARFSTPLMPSGTPTDAQPRPASSLPSPASEHGVSTASPAGDSILSEETMREVLEVARRQEESYRSMARQNPYENSPFSPISPEGTQTPTEQLTRAPSPTEARPIRPIRVPDDFVPLQARQWEAKRKYWSAPGTCYMPLYFQDAVLERYGQSAEQALGPRWGRFFTYPLDDPRESTQRNQILQPFYSIGKFASQIVVLPYNLVMDPPWEAQYDLGYYRPGDRIPPDSIYLPKTGIGPPLHSRSY
jgi:hypothetical protein